MGVWTETNPPTIASPSNVRPAIRKPPTTFTIPSASKTASGPVRPTPPGRTVSNKPTPPQSLETTIPNESARTKSSQVKEPQDNQTRMMQASRNLRGSLKVAAFKVERQITLLPFSIIEHGVTTLEAFQTLEKTGIPPPRIPPLVSKKIGKVKVHEPLNLETCSRTFLQDSDKNQHTIYHRASGLQEAKASVKNCSGLDTHDISVAKTLDAYLDASLLLTFSAGNNGARGDSKGGGNDVSGPPSQLRKRKLGLDAIKSTTKRKRQE